jgi:hypothetical protein
MKQKEKAVFIQNLGLNVNISAISTDEIQRQISAPDCKMLVTTPAFLPTLKGLKLPTSIMGGSAKGCHSFSEMSQVNSSSTEFPNPSREPGRDLAMIFFSSGTSSGNPRPALHTHSTLSTNLLQYTSPDIGFLLKYEEEMRQDRILGLTGFSHPFGIMVSLLSGIFLGAHTFCPPKVQQDQILGHVRKYRVRSLIKDSVQKCGKAHVFELAENFTKCRSYHREQISNFHKGGRTHGFTCRGQRTEPYCYVKETGGKREGRGPFAKGFSLTPTCSLQKKTPPFLPPQIKPIVLPTFYPFKSCSL